MFYYLVLIISLIITIRLVRIILLPLLPITHSYVLDRKYSHNNQGTHSKVKPPHTTASDDRVSPAKQGPGG